MKWFDQLPPGSIESFHQLTESFMAQFVINTKVSKGVGSLLILRKGKNESIKNYSKRYWETYNEIEKCSKELLVARYKLGLTPKERLWKNLTLNPPPISGTSCPRSKCLLDWRMKPNRQSQIQVQLPRVRDCSRGTKKDQLNTKV